MALGNVLSMAYAATGDAFGIGAVLTSITGSVFFLGVGCIVIACVIFGIRVLFMHNFEHLGLGLIAIAIGAGMIIGSFKISEAATSQAAGASLVEVWRAVTTAESVSDAVALTLYCGGLGSLSASLRLLVDRSKVRG